jgi:hypothetical protein
MINEFSNVVVSIPTTYSRSFRIVTWLTHTELTHLSYFTVFISLHREVLGSYPKIG